MHVWEVEVFHRIFSATIRDSIEEPTKPSGDLEPFNAEIGLRVVTLSALKHEDKIISRHLVTHPRKVWQLAPRIPSSLRLWEYRGILTVASDERVWILPLAAGVFKLGIVLIPAQATSFTLKQEMLVYNKFMKLPGKLIEPPKPLWMVLQNVVDNPREFSERGDLQVMPIVELVCCRRNTFPKHLPNPKRPSGR